MSIPYLFFVGVSVIILKEFNAIVDEPYMDEPFHVPQAQAYCRGEFMTWDAKITTPPGLYVMSLLLKKLFLFKCTLPMLRLTTMLALLALPIVLTRLLSFHQRIRTPTSILVPSVDAVVLSTFPVVWFFGFMYYTEVPSLAFVTWSIVSANQGKHKTAALLGLVSCTFRQTNIVWVMYAFASSQLMHLRFRRALPGAAPLPQLHDPMVLDAVPSDLIRSILSAPHVLSNILPSFIPYAFVLMFFGMFVAWNGGIVLGDKSNHVPSFHVPQVYYFVAFSTIFGWPVLICGDGGALGLGRDVFRRMFGTKSRIIITAMLSAIMSLTVQLYTIHHPFLLADNRHYTFYVWRRIYMLHPAVPHLLIPLYLASAWAWFLRVAQDQTLLQTLILPVLVLPTLLPTPLLEPRYFLIPYVLLRAQVTDVPSWAVALEGLWYAGINALTMWVFLYKERVGVGRFMW